MASTSGYRGEGGYHKKYSMASLCTVSRSTYAWLARLQRPIVFVFRRGLKRVEMARSVWPHLQDRGEVPAAVAVVGRGPHRAESVVVQHAVSLHAQLVCPQNVVHLVHLQKVLHHRGTKCVPGATRGDGKLLLVWVGIGPHQVRHRALVRNLAEAVDDLHLVDVVHRGRQAAVQTKDPVVDHHREREKVKHIGEVVPHLRVGVLAHAFGIEPVRLRHRAALVVPTHELHTARVPQLEARQERNGLEGKQATVHIVAQKQVVGVGCIAANPENLEQVVELAV